MSRRLRRADVVVAAALGAAAVAVHLSYWDRGFILLDEGYVATVASILNRGGAVYRDAVTYVLPGSYDLLALAFRLAGESLMVGRALTLALTATFVASATLVARAALPRPAAIVTGAVFLLHSVWSYPQWHVFGYQQPALVAVVAAAAMLGPPAVSPGRAAIAGLLVGAAIVCKQTYATAAGTLGVFLVLDAVLARGARARATVIAFAAGVAAPVALMFAGLAWIGTFDDFVEQGLVAPLWASRHFADYAGLPALRPLLHQDPALRAALPVYLPPLLQEVALPALRASAVFRDTALVDVGLKAAYWAPVAVLAAAGLRLLARARRLPAWWATDRGAVLLVAIDLALLTGLNRPLDWMHVAFAYPGTLWLGAWLVTGGGGARRGALAALGLVVLLASWPTARLVGDLRAAMHAPLDLARARIRARPDDAAVLRRTVDAVTAATKPDEPILVLPYHPLLYFLADRPPATRFLFTWPIEYLTTRDAEMVQALDARHVGTVVVAPGAFPPLGTLAGNAPILLAAIADRFRVVEVVGRERWGPSFIVLGRRPPARPGARLVIASLDQARAARRRDDRVEERPTAELARETVWPSDRVLAVHLTPGGTTELRLPLDAGVGQLRLGYGMNPDRWVAEHPVPLRFTATLERDGESVPLLAATRNPQADVADRPWIEWTVALDGRPGTLVLAVAAPPDAPDDGDLAGWVVPRIEP